MRNETIVVELNMRDYIDIKAEYTKKELMDVIRRMRADGESVRKYENKYCVA